MNNRIKKILDAVELFSNTGRKNLVAGKLYDYFMQEFEGELAVLYEGVSKKEVREDIKTLADILYDEEVQIKKDFLVGVLRRVVRLMAKF